MDVKEIRLILKKMNPNKVRELRPLLWIEDETQEWFLNIHLLKS